MPTESAVFTVLPNGFTPDGLLRATVFCSPRLSADGAAVPLSKFDAFANWPKVLAHLKWAVEVDAVGTIEASLDPDAPQADSEMWQLIFGGDPDVVDAKFADRDLSDRVVRSFPANEVAQHVLDLYDAVITSDPTRFPPVTTGPLAQLAAEIGRIPDQRVRDYKQLDRLIAQEQSEIVEGRSGRYLNTSSVPFSQRRQVAFAQTQRFYDRFLDGEPVASKPGPLDPSAVPAPPKPPKLDFNTYLAALGDYPYLLRKLGIAVDIVFKHNPALGGAHRIRLVVGGDAPPWMETEQARPWLNYTLKEPLFLPRPRSEGQTMDGQLNLPSDFYAVHQIDIDGSALKTLGVAQSALSVAQRIRSRAESVQPDEMSLPALRTTGFTLVRWRRAEGVVAAFDHQVVHNQREEVAKPADLFSEDVTRGYRLDIAVDEKPDFGSQCLRVGTYLLRTPSGDVVLDVPPDEGYVKGSSTTSVPGDKELYLHEAVLSWAGWSLVSKRPGKHVDTDEELTEDVSAPDEKVPLVTSFRPASGSLARLRYGRPYQFRVLLVDLAGNSVQRDAIDDRYATRTEKFFRWEPVNAPVVLPCRAYGEGESQLRMVIRSTLGVDAPSYVQLPRVTSLPGHDEPENAYLDHNDRWLAAPKTSQQMAEWHGMFDDATFAGASQNDVDAAFKVASRESGVLPEQIQDETLALPYLPDVSGRGAALTTLPGDADGSTHRVDWPSDAVAEPWWDRQPFRARIVDGPSGTAPAWDAEARVLTVVLPQAEMVHVKVASAIDGSDLEIQGLWNRVGALLTNAQAKDVAQSQAWALTPWHDLTLVHAVEKPLTAPVVNVSQTGMQRQPGETFCSLVGTVDNHARSTGRLDVEANWTEQIDDVTDPLGPEDGENGRPPREGFAHVGDFNLGADEDACQVGRDEVRPSSAKAARHRLRHEFGDTKHRQVTYRATATTRFREYFPPEVIDGVEDGVRLIEHPGKGTTRHVSSSRRPDPPEIAYVVPIWAWTESKDRFRIPGRESYETVTRTRSGGGLRVYLKRGWYSSGDGELLGVVLNDQPWFTWPLDLNAGMYVSEAARNVAESAAARLVGDKIVEPSGQANLSLSEKVLRGFGLETADFKSADLLTMSKVSRALGVAEKSISEQIIGLLAQGMDPAKLVTHVGRDPLWGSALPSGGPFIHQFPLRVQVGNGLSLAETTKAKVTVVGHKPRYDAERGLWYCDIQLNAGLSYLPFVRLALCRYQPWSVPGMHISRVVLADFAQLLPERRASFNKGRSEIAVTVRGSAGYTQTAGRMTSKPEGAYGISRSRRMTACLQELASGADDSLGWAPVGDEVELTPSGALEATSWTGKVAVSTAPVGARQRILVREYELLETDPDPDDPLGATFKFRFGPVEFPETVNMRSRIVYADTWEL